MNDTPKGFRKIETYTDGKTLIALEWPEEDDENHNCDAMGCGSFSHVKYRVDIPDWQALQKQPEGATHD